MDKDQVLRTFDDFKAPSIYKLPPIVWKRARGIYVEDMDGKKYMDFGSCVMTTNTGHCPPEVVEAVKRQAENFLGSFDYATEDRAELQKRLAEMTPTALSTDSKRRVLLLTGGSEIVEAAVKIARKYTGKYDIVTTHGAWHGRSTIFATYLTDVPGSGHKVGFGPGAPGVLHTSYGYCYRCEFEKEYPSCNILCARHLVDVLDMESSDHVAALIVEPVQGGGGIIVPPVEYIRTIRKICEERQILFIADEFLTGLGRTGKWFAIEHFGIEPDIIVMGKGLAAGLPIAAAVARESVMNSLKMGDLTSTFGGNPLAHAAALANIEYMQKHRVVENAAAVGEYAMKMLKEVQEKYPIIGDIRGLGLMIGLEFVKDRANREPAFDEVWAVQRLCRERGLIVHVPQGRAVLMITPPLIVTREEAEEGMQIIEDSIKDMTKGAPVQPPMY